MTMEMRSMKTYLSLALVWFTLTGHGQQQIRIDSVIWEKGQTVFCRGKEMKTGEVYFFSMTKKGAGKWGQLVGQWATKRENVFKRRVKEDFVFILNQ